MVCAAINSSFTLMVTLMVLLTAILTVILTVTLTLRVTRMVTRTVTGARGVQEIRFPVCNTSRAIVTIPLILNVIDITLVRQLIKGRLMTILTAMAAMIVGMCEIHGSTMMARIIIIFVLRLDRRS